MTTPQPGLAAFPSAGGVTCTGSALGASKPTAGMTRIECQVAGCTNELPAGKVYYARHKICWEHSRLRSFFLGGREAVRWCQQCGMFQYLSEFDGDKRSCKISLNRHNGRRRSLRAVRRRPSPTPACAVPRVAMPGQVAPTHQLAAPTNVPGTALIFDPSLETFPALMMQLPGGYVPGTGWDEGALSTHAAAGLLAADEQVIQGVQPLTSWQHVMHACAAGTQGPQSAPASQGPASSPCKALISTTPCLAPPLIPLPSGKLLTQSTLSELARSPGQQRPQRTPKTDEEKLQYLTYITSLRCLTGDWHHDEGGPLLQAASIGQQRQGITALGGGGALVDAGY